MRSDVQSRRLEARLRAAGVPLHGIAPHHPNPGGARTVRTLDGVPITIHYKDATPAQQAAGDALVAASSFAPTPAQEATDVLDEMAASGKVQAALVMVSSPGPVPQWARDVLAARRAAILAALSGRDPGAED
jgi:hypothetical protein